MSVLSASSKAEKGAVFYRNLPEARQDISHDIEQLNEGKKSWLTMFSGGWLLSPCGSPQWRQALKFWLKPQELIHNIFRVTEYCWARYKRSEATRRRSISVRASLAFVPMKVRKDKGLPDLKKGDLVEITVNDQNLLVDVHIAGESSDHHVVKGQLAGPLETGHDKAVIRTSDGKEQSHFVRPVARSKVASVPVGAEVLFLIDELDKIVDVTFGSKEAAARSSEQSLKMSPLKGNLAQVRGKIVKPLHDNTIVIQTQDGKERSYEVRPLIQPRLSELSKGDTAVLLVDNEQKVTDVAFEPPSNK